MIAIWGTLCCLTILNATAATEESAPSGTPLDARRIEALRALDARFRLAGEDPSLPTPNLTIRHDYHEHYYQDKVAAIFGLVDAGQAPEERLEEANRLLRLEMLGKWRITSPGQLAGDSGIWMHRSRSLGMRLYLLYAEYMDEDIQEEYVKRLRWMVRAPFNNKSENIKLTNNSAYFLAHEALGETNAPTFAQVKDWLIQYLKHHGEQGTHEWGSSYNAWTFLAILNLAEFANDTEVKTLATMVVDYDLARILIMSVDGNFCSPGVRRYFFWTVNGYVEPQTHLALLLCSQQRPDRNVWADWALSNYAPLKLHESLCRVEPPYEAEFTDDAQTGRGIRWLSRIYRGTSFGIATHQSVTPNGYTLPSGGTHDIIGCYVQSAKDPSNHVVPYGYTPGMTPKKKRDVTERYFGYANMAFVQHGGVTKSVWAGGGVFDKVPIRLFYRPDFTCEIVENWAFLSDGVTHVAWAPTVGKPVRDDMLNEVSDPGKEGRWLKSSHVPDQLGEIAVIEAGDNAMFGSFEDFKSNIRARNPQPRVVDGKVVYTAIDGAQIEFGADYAAVNGQRFAPESYPKANAPGIDGNKLKADNHELLFDFDAGQVHGDLERVPAHIQFGQAKDANE